MARISKRTQKDFEEIREAWREFVADLSDPWTATLMIIALVATAVMMAAPLLADDGFGWAK